jgi:prepilin-type N-terminal cleavage/methylation domain-containing protein
MQKEKEKGFTLIELLVVIATIGVLASVVLVASRIVQAKARDSQRKANLLQVSKALELYLNDNGTYPSTGGQWWGVTSLYGSHATSGSNGYIPNLAPQYLQSLPRDPLTNRGGGTSFCNTAGYWSYLYNSNGTDYKLIAHCVPESYPTDNAYYDPNRPTWAWAVYSPGGIGW